MFIITAFPHSIKNKWNEEMLQMVGFREVDCFWRWGNFAGWLAVKS